MRRERTREIRARWHSVRATDEGALRTLDATQRRRRGCARRWRRRRARSRRIGRSVRRGTRRWWRRCGSSDEAEISERRGARVEARAVGLTIERRARWGSQQAGNKAESENRLQAEFNAEIAKLHGQVNAAKASVVSDLLNAVTSA